jgi:methyl-accepting chemotaxis protein
VPEAPKRGPSIPFTTLATVALPILIGILVGRLAGASTLAELPADPAAVAGGVLDILTWSVVIGGLVGLGLLAYRLRSAEQAGGGADAVVERLAAADYSGALDAARRLGVATPEIENAINRLTSATEARADGVERQKRNLENISGALTSLGEGLAQQVEAINNINQSVDKSRAFLHDITTNVDGLARGAEETSSSILEMVATNNEVTENIHNLAQSVQETTTAIEEMTFSIKEVARNIEDLSTAAEETAASMNQMDVSISQVETNANETSRLSETVSTDAEMGVGAINRTIQGIDRIKDSSRIAADAIGSLGQKIDEIGNILTVIDDVAEQTNLLALNAAIIAAQAGEHGRGFAVVADEIKALAERTGASTKEIAELIKAVQAESRNAIGTMSQGVDAVEEGVQLGHNAEEALLKIVDSAKRSTLMIKAIAQATVEQAKGSKQVTNAISRIAETVQQIALATSEQAKGSEQIMKSAERMRVITQQVERSTEEQNRGGKQVTRAIESISEIVDRVTAAQNEQLRTTDELAEATRAARESGKRAATVRNDAEGQLAAAAEQLDRLTERAS